CQDGSWQEALDLFHECAKLEEFEGSKTRQEMEEALDPVCTKSAIKMVRAVENLSEIPACCYDHTHENVRCEGNIFAIYAPNRPQEGVRTARSDGTLIRHISLSETVKAVWIRQEKIYAFSEPGEYAVYDLEGNELQHALMQETVQGLIQQDQQNQQNKQRKKGFSLFSDLFANMRKDNHLQKTTGPIYFDLDYHGENLLFARTDAGEEWIWQRNLKTGQEQRLVRRTYGEVCAYLQDGTILFPETWIPEDELHGPCVESIGRYRAENWEIVRTYQVLEDDIFCSNCTFRMNQEKTRFFTKMDYDNTENFGSGNIQEVMAFDMDSEEDYCLESWAEFPEEHKGVILLPGCEFVFGFQKEKIFIFDTRNDVITPSFSEKSLTTRVVFRPDGREFYVKTEEGPKAFWKKYQIEFDYTMSETEDFTPGPDTPPGSATAR
ncbi:MAG: hypothetical protein IJI24_01760, partial [Lachnospiraceae bacterium]|nr:hypothetical protein [Lachnospiraceae bacterium]